MIRPLRSRLFAAGVCAANAIVLAAPSYAQNAPDTAFAADEAAQLAAIVDWMRGMNVIEQLSRPGLIQRLAGDDPGQLDLATRFVDQTFPDAWFEQTTAEAARFWLPYLSREDAEDAARYVRSAGGKKRSQIELAKNAGKTPPEMTREEQAEVDEFSGHHAPAVLLRYAPQLVPQQTELVMRRYNERVGQLTNGAYQQMRSWPAARRQAELDRLVNGTSTLSATEQMGLVRAYSTLAMQADADFVQAKTAELRKADEARRARALLPQELNQSQHDFFAALKELHAGEAGRYREIADTTVNYAAGIAAPRNVAKPWQDRVRRIVQDRVAMAQEQVDTFNHVADLSLEQSDFLAGRHSRMTFSDGKTFFADPNDQRRYDELSRRIAQLWVDLKKRQADHAAALMAP